MRFLALVAGVGADREALGRRRAEWLRRPGPGRTVDEMITRSKLVEQLRDYQIRSQHKWGVLKTFSPKPQITTRRDLFVALIYALVFVLLVVSCYAALYSKYYKISVVIVCLGILLPTCLKFSRHRWLARKRERRMLLPLSM